MYASLGRLKDKLEFIFILIPALFLKYYKNSLYNKV